MIPRNEILKQINRFYDILEEVDSKIEKSKDTPDFELLESYFNLTSKTGYKLMNCVEDVKCELDRIESKIKNK